MSMRRRIRDKSNPVSAPLGSGLACKVAASRGTFPNPTGTSCHLAATLHSLLASPAILRALRSHVPGHFGSESCVLCLLQKTEHATHVPGSSLAPLSLWRAWLERKIGDPLRQHDAAEDILHILHGCCESDNWSHFLSTQLLTQYAIRNCSCLADGTRKNPVSAVLHVVEIHEGTSHTTQPDILEQEALGSSFESHCEFCGARNARKQTSAFVVVGDVLVLNLKRRSGDRITRRSVTCPEEMDVGGARVDLKAIVAHEWEHFDSGHYVAFVKQDAAWTLYDDAHARV